MANSYVIQSAHRVEPTYKHTWLCNSLFSGHDFVIDEQQYDHLRSILQFWDRPRYLIHLPTRCQRCGKKQRWELPQKFWLSLGHYVPSYMRKKDKDPIPERKSVAPTQEELVDARKRLQPYLEGHPEPMVDTRRMRIANGNPTEQDVREVNAEDQVLRELRQSLKDAEKPPPEVYGDGTTSDDWMARYSCTITVSIRQRTDIDYFSSAVESQTLHFSMDEAGVDWSARDVARAVVGVHEKWRNKHLKVEAEKLLKEYSAEELVAAARHLKSQNGGS